MQQTNEKKMAHTNPEEKMATVEAKKKEKEEEEEKKKTVHMHVDTYWRQQREASRRNF